METQQISREAVSTSQQEADEVEVPAEQVEVPAEQVEVAADKWVVYLLVRMYFVKLCGQIKSTSYVHIKNSFRSSAL